MITKNFSQQNTAANSNKKPPKSPRPQKSTKTNSPTQAKENKTPRCFSPKNYTNMKKSHSISKLYESVLHDRKNSA
jgi:hypothetical protein